MSGALPGGFFYNTNGFAFHRLDDVVEILADLGYDGIALTPDVHHLDPVRRRPDFDAEVRRLRDDLETRGLSVIIETGARFVLDPRRKHRPSLMDPPKEAQRRLDFLERCVSLASDLGAKVVSVWSGSAPVGTDRRDAMRRLVDGLGALCDVAGEKGVRIGLEPEPGMAVERVGSWPELRDRVAHAALGLTLDVGHCLATRECEPAEAIREHAGDLLVLQLDDHRRGVHDHLAFGEGDVDLVSVAEAVRASGFAGPLEVELSRHSSVAPEMARRSIDLLRGVFGNANGAGAP